VIGVVVYNNNPIEDGTITIKTPKQGDNKNETSSDLKVPTTVNPLLEPANKKVLTEKEQKEITRFEKILATLIEYEKLNPGLEIEVWIERNHYKEYCLKSLEEGNQIFGSAFRHTDPKADERVYIEDMDASIFNYITTITFKNANDETIDLGFLSSLQLLKSVHFDDSTLTESQLSAIGSVSTLKILGLNESKFELQHLTYCNHVEWLDITNNEHGQKSLDVIRNFDQLKELRMGGIPVYAETFKRFKESNPNVKYVGIVRN